MLSRETPQLTECLLINIVYIKYLCPKKQIYLYIVLCKLELLCYTARGTDLYLSTGIGIQTSVRLQALASAFNIPNKFSSLPKGMFGNFNGNISDDFVLPNGDTLGNNLTEREIFNKFSPKCNSFVS